ncbi:helix-turn-helix domain-containing protein [Sinorhizobium medicae]
MHENTTTIPEPMFTIQNAAEIFGVHVWALRRAIKSGTIPAYAPFNGRKLVRLSEVAAAINAAKVGGANG